MIISNLKRSALLVLAVTSLAGTMSTASASGRGLFNQHCVRCHGFEGNGDSMPGTPIFSRGQGLHKDTVQLKQRILRGGMTCPSYEGILTEREALDVVSYLRTLY